MTTTPPVGSLARQVWRYAAPAQQLQPEQDHLAIEEPLELRLDYDHKGRRVGQSVSITMRTPGQDEALAVGFLFTEGIITSAAQVRAVGPCGQPDPLTGLHNVVKVELEDEVPLALERLKRHFYTSSSCGVCGKASLEALSAQYPAWALPSLELPRLAPALLGQLPERLREAQACFELTGGLHACGLFDAQTGALLRLCEDVGRHNALDKLIGQALLEGELPLSQHVLILSGRASFELLQKAAMAGISVVAAVGAPSSLAVELAQRFQITLIGFLRPQRFNVYTHPSRLEGGALQELKP